MKFSVPVKIVYRSIASAKLKFFLTVLGVVIGVAAVIMVMSIGAGAERFVVAQVEEIGSNLLGILPGASEENGPPAMALGIITTTLINEDLKVLREKSNAPHLIAVTGYVTGSATVKSQYKITEASFQGVSPDLVNVENVSIGEGRFFFQEEENNLARVAVLGFKRARELFPQQSFIGETIKIKDVSFKVVGVLKEKGSSGFSNLDDSVFVPLETAQKILLGINYLNFARAKVDFAQNITAASDDARKLLRKRHKIDNGEEDDFSIRNTAQAIGTLTKVTNILSYFLSAIAAVSLIVGGIGIMNSMLISVSQRVKEIGLRKSLGARPRHILTQFILEAGFITMAGGIIGVIIGISLSFFAAIAIQKLGYAWEFIVPPISVALGFGVSVAIGIIFGIYPALKAAKVSPMEALRYE